MPTHTVYCAIRDGRDSEMVKARSQHATHAEALAEAARLNADRLRGFRFFVEPLAGAETVAGALGCDTSAEIENIKQLLKS